METIKEQIITTALDFFSQYGIKSVSMDDIAHNAGISKRTLYGFFEDKETLLVEGLQYTNDRLNTLIQLLENENHTAIDIVLLVNEEAMKRPRWYTQKFYEDLRKYPRAMQQKEFGKTQMAETCSRLLSRGVNEGIFHPEINFEIVSLLAKEQFKMLSPSRSFSRHSNAEVYNTVLLTFLRGICTEKGRLIIDRWITTHKVINIIQ